MCVVYLVVAGFGRFRWYRSFGAEAHTWLGYLLRSVSKTLKKTAKGRTVYCWCAFCSFTALIVCFSTEWFQLLIFTARAPMLSRSW